MTILDAATVRRNPDAMTDPSIRGWCPDLFAPMLSSDGWLLRLKPPLARLTAVQGQSIASQALRHGNGIIELTGRGNLQLRGLTPRSAESFARFAVEAGLASADPAVERRRNILLSPMAGPAACEVALALADGLAKDGALRALPGKFGFAVDGNGALRLGDTTADILLRSVGDEWQVGGGASAGIIPCGADHAASAALALAHDWVASGATVRPSHGTAGRETAGRDAVGWLPEMPAFGVGLPFGQMDAAMLDCLCALSQLHGDGMLHLTPWRAILLSGVSSPDAVRRASLDAGWITTPDDPQRRVSACIGRTGCASGTVDARGDARALLRAGVRAPSLHVSGCAKGCAHPGVSAITLVGAGGRYGLVREGRAGDTAQVSGLTLAQVARRLALGRVGSTDGL